MNEIRIFCEKRQGEVKTKESKFNNIDIESTYQTMNHPFQLLQNSRSLSCPYYATSELNQDELDFHKLEDY